MNFFDIHPAIMQNERCCGHDLLWSGDRDNFIEIARLNVRLISEMGIEEMVTACPECYRAFSHDYPENGIETQFKVTHIFELAEAEISKGAIGFSKLNRKITFQRPAGWAAHKPHVNCQESSPAAKCRAFTEMRDSGAFFPLLWKLRLDRM